MESDLQALERLNRDYINSVQHSDVRIRILGDVAIIHAQTRYTTADGRKAVGRYTDIWARRQGRWLAVAAHVTRG